MTKLISYWSIGTCNNIPLWNTKWLANGTTIPKPDYGVHDLDQWMLSDLIDSNSKQWSVPLVRSLFTKHIAASILNTPLFSSVPEDRLL